MTASPRFEDRLFEQLRDVVAAARPEPAVVRSRRPRQLSVAAAGVAAAAVAIVLVATGSNVTPGAYAVESRPDGAISVSIRSLRDADGLQRSLRAAGLPAFVDYAATGRPGCAPPAAEGRTETRGKGETGPTLSRKGTPPAGGGKDVRRAKTVSSVRVDGSGAATFTLDPGPLKPGEHVYITTSTGAVSTIGIAIGKVKPAGC
jgi:hypothetical protein